MPFASVCIGVGKIISPLFCEFQVDLMGIGLIFYTLIVATGVLMFGVIMLNSNLRGIDWSSQKAVVLDESENVED